MRSRSRSASARAQNAEGGPEDPASTSRVLCLHRHRQASICLQQQANVLARIVEPRDAKDVWIARKIAHGKRME